MGYFTLSVSNDLTKNLKILMLSLAISNKFDELVIFSMKSFNNFISSRRGPFSYFDNTFL